MWQPAHECRTSASSRGPIAARNRNNSSRWGTLPFVRGFLFVAEQDTRSERGPQTCQRDFSGKPGDSGITEGIAERNSEKLKYDGMKFAKYDCNSPLKIAGL